MRQRALTGPLIARLAEYPDRFFPAARITHLDRLGISALKVNPDPVTIATEAQRAFAGDQDRLRPAPANAAPSPRGARK
jgi:hypothetical protein